MQQKQQQETPSEKDVDYSNNPHVIFYFAIEKFDAGDSTSGKGGEVIREIDENPALEVDKK
jgi:hypothetical protein